MVCLSVRVGMGGRGCSSIYGLLQVFYCHRKVSIIKKITAEWSDFVLKNLKITSNVKNGIDNGNKVTIEI